MRRGIISRERAVNKVYELEGKFPVSYMGKSTEKILDKIGLSTTEFKKYVINLQIKKFLRPISLVNLFLTKKEI